MRHAVRFQNRAVLFHERRRVVAPAPLGRRAQIAQTTRRIRTRLDERRLVFARQNFRREKNARVVVELRDGLVRGPSVEALDGARVLVRHEPPPHASPQLRDGRLSRQVDARRRLAKALVRDVVLGIGVLEGKIELRVALGQPPLGLREVAPTLSFPMGVVIAAGKSALAKHDLRVFGKVGDPRHDGVPIASPAEPTRARVYNCQIIERAHRAQPPRLRGGREIELFSSFFFFFFFFRDDRIIAVVGDPADVVKRRSRVEFDKRRTRSAAHDDVGGVEISAERYAGGVELGQPGTHLETHQFFLRVTREYRRRTGEDRAERVPRDERRRRDEHGEFLLF